MSKDNIGELGVDSIRLNGQKIEEMPLGTNNEALSQIADALQVQRLNAIADVNARYPSHRVDYLVARINECEENKNRMKRFRSDQMQKIAEYRELVGNCKTRDRLLEDESDKDKRKEITKTWGPWDLDALKQQIVQFEENIERTEAVISEEDDAIKKFTETLTLCRQRDKELAALNAKAEGSYPQPEA